MASKELRKGLAEVNEDTAVLCHAALLQHGGRCEFLELYCMFDFVVVWHIHTGGHRCRLGGLSHGNIQEQYKSRDGGGGAGRGGEERGEAKLAMASWTQLPLFWHELWPKIRRTDLRQLYVDRSQLTFARILTFWTCSSTGLSQADMIVVSTSRKKMHQRIHKPSTLKTASSQSE